MNPTNQPEPKQNDSPKEVVSPNSAVVGVHDSSIPDAQTEVGLRGVISEILVKWDMPTRQAAINEIMAAAQAERDAAVQEAALVNADLAWCLGKLRGLGNPAEHLEQKYQLARLQPPTASESPS